MFVLSIIIGVRISSMACLAVMQKYHKDRIPLRCDFPQVFRSGIRIFPDQRTSVVIPVVRVSEESGIEVVAVLLVEIIVRAEDQSMWTSG